VHLPLDKYRLEEIEGCGIGLGDAPGDRSLHDPLEAIRSSLHAGAVQVVGVDRLDDPVRGACPGSAARIVLVHGREGRALAVRPGGRCLHHVVGRRDEGREELIPLVIGDRGRGQVGDFGGEVVSHRVDNAQGEPCVVEPDRAVLAVLHPVLLSILAQSHAAGVVTDDNGDRPLVHSRGRSVERGSSHEVRPELHTLRSGDALRDLDLDPRLRPVAEQTSGADGQLVGEDRLDGVEEPRLVLVADVRVAEDPQRVHRVEAAPSLLAGDAALLVAVDHSDVEGSDVEAEQVENLVHRDSTGEVIGRALAVVPSVAALGGEADAGLSVQPIHRFAGHVSSFVRRV